TDRSPSHDFIPPPTIPQLSLGKWLHIITSAPLLSFDLPLISQPPTRHTLLFQLKKG
ncbi:hypothetical protein KUCAC02_000557, partial [Chaenocephalus aceratus]